MDVDVFWLSCNLARQQDRQDLISFFSYLSCRRLTESIFRRSQDSIALLFLLVLLNIAPRTSRKPRAVVAWLDWQYKI